MRKNLMLITSARVKIQLKLYVHWTVFEEQYHAMGLIKIHTGGNYAHAQDSNAYDLC